MVSQALLHAVPAPTAPRDATVERARMRLSEAAMTRAVVPAPGAAALEDLADQLLEMRGRGFTVDDLAELLVESGIHVRPNDLREYLQGRVVNHVFACSSASAEGAVGSSARVAFIETGLRRALDSGMGLALHYQPQVDIANGAMVGAEALLRWRHGSELVSPTEFIPIAERSDLIDRLGEWVLRRAAADASKWLHDGLGHAKGIKVAVNVSVKQLTRRLAGVVHGALCDAGLPARLLTLEITESQLAQEGAHGLLQELRDSGLQIAVDDFGTGYSSLSRVNRFPLDIIKIDRSFVQDLGTLPAASAVVESIVGMAKKLGIGVVAEGVETDLQANALQGLGCGTAQGYLYARPLPADEFVLFASGRTL